MSEVKSDIEEYCPMNIKQVTDFLENYSCASQLKPVDHSSLPEIDEDKEMAFINSQRNLFNTSEQTVYVVRGRD